MQNRISAAKRLRHVCLKVYPKINEMKKNERFSITPSIPNCLPFLENFAFCKQKNILFMRFPTKDKQFGTDEIFFLSLIQSPLSKTHLSAYLVYR